jgi:hypothetical protein
VASKLSGKDRIFDTFIPSPVRLPELGPKYTTLVGDPADRRGRTLAFTCFVLVHEDDEDSVLYESDALMTGSEIERLTRKKLDAEVGA